MAIYENLPVFKLSYDLLISVFRICSNLNREHRYSLGERLKSELMDLMIDIYKANCSEEKAPYLSEAREKIVAIKLYVRLLHDLRGISLKQFALLSDQMESISKQLAAWYKKCSHNVI